MKAAFPHLRVLRGSGEKLQLKIEMKIKKLFLIIREAFQRKIDVGVHVPTYPQFRDMIGQFLDIIKDEKNCYEPYVLREENAKILELEIIDEVVKNSKKRQARLLELEFVLQVQQICTFRHSEQQPF